MSLPEPAQDCRMQINLDQKLNFPPVVITNNVRPDLVLQSTSQKYIMHVVELYANHEKLQLVKQMNAKVWRIETRRSSQNNVDGAPRCSL